jgi:NTP pyrophosphatase (non-canonical NTP hydrolase)
MLKPEILEKLISFRSDRDWQQFHNPKDLAISLSIEASELLEWFQWKTNDEIKAQLQSTKRQALEDELADVAAYLAYLCHDLGVDINKALAVKIDKNTLKYPIDQVKGRADKYTEYS